MPKVLVFLALAVGACAPIKQELRHSGGVVGKQLDKHFFDAGSKRAQLLRATMITSLTSRVAVGSLNDGDDADAFLKRLHAVQRELNYLAADLGDDATANNCAVDELQKDCLTRSTLFESNLPQMEYKVGRMLIAALPQREGGCLCERGCSG